MESKIIELRQISLDELRNVISESVRIEIANLKNSIGNNKEFLNRDEVAQLLHISLVSLNTYSKEGLLQSYKIGGRILYKKEEVLSTLEKVKNLKYKREA
jgi:hypothetical protein